MKKTLLTAAAVTTITGVASFQAQAHEHEVKAGETLWAIAKENGTSVAELKSLNKLSNDLIHVGDKIKVASKDFYVVKSGDTLKTIAKKFDVQVSDLEKWNDVSEETLKVGKKLIVSQEGFDKASKQHAAPARVAMAAVKAPVAKEAKAASVDTAETVAASEHQTTSTEGEEIAQSASTESEEVAQTATVQTSAKTTTSPVGGNVAAVANSMAAGKTYVYGGNSGSAVDCSSFAQQVLAAMGKSIPRTTYAQMAAGTQVSDPQPGDLVFFNGGSHVGVYIGNGQMVDALNPSEGVKQRAVSYVNGSVTGYYRY